MPFGLTKHAGHLVGKENMHPRVQGLLHFCSEFSAAIASCPCLTGEVAQEVATLRELVEV